MNKLYTEDGVPVKPNRSRRIVARRLSLAKASVGWWLTIRLHMSDDTIDATTYGVEEIGSQTGRSFELTRVAGNGCLSYRVHLSGTGQQCCQRTTGQLCPSFERSRGVRCKHTDSIRMLLDTGRILGGLPGPGYDAEIDGTDTY